MELCLDAVEGWVRASAQQCTESMGVWLGDLIITKFFSTLSAQCLVRYLNSVNLDQNVHDSVSLCLLTVFSSVCAFTRIKVHTMHLS